jgi:hypothetical protein
MAIQQYKVWYSTTSSGFSNFLTDVVNVQINVGRQQQLDQIKASTASISLRYPNGYASPITALVTGSYVMIQNITNPASPYSIWYGRITDVSASYGIPYQGSVGNADYLDISCEGVFASAGRMQGNGYSMTADTIANQLTAANTQTGLNLNYLPAGATTALAATTVSGTWGDWVARVCQSTNSRLWDGAHPVNSTIVSPFYPLNSPVEFSDVMNGPQVYNQILFDSIADNYYTQVTVTPESFGSATVTASGATTPYRAYQANTLNSSTGQATDYANYLLNNYSNPSLGIGSITCIGEAQTDFKLDKVGYDNQLATAPGSRTTVSFRGTLYTCIIEGVTMNATPFGSTFTYYLSDADMNSYLILDEPIVGRLDYNKLGW